MNIDKEIYNGIEIQSHYNKDNKDFYATSKIANSVNKSYENPLEAVEDVKLMIDEFLKQTPKTYSELTSMITDSLVWTGYEDCHADEEIIRQLVSSFIKMQK